ncbi:uL30 family ribosomal protein [Candidatus Woesearchaeota archaeon]|nr:uL30 family ribosomal protein [Candidatus Woesearchaeota archaeon]
MANTPVSKKPTNETATPVQGKSIAVVRVRGTANLKQEFVDTFVMLRLYRKNYGIVVPNTPSMLGMIACVKDFVTWGPIDDATWKMLVEKKGQAATGDKERDFLVVDGKKIKRYFRLNPPRKGFGRKGIKVPFSNGGALGDRKEKINDLLQRMM